jgi:hypothetical protein
MKLHAQLTKDKIRLQQKHAQQRFRENLAQKQLSDMK